MALYASTAGKGDLWTALLPEDRAPLPVFVVAAADTDGEGRFRFDELRARKYFLGVLLPQAFGDDPATVSIRGRLGPFDLAVERHVDAGTVIIVPTAPQSPPPAAGRSSAR